MASQALYRRYRSQTFSELIGQEHIVQTLRNALAEGRIAHAYLFTGPRGVGKTTVARLLAKAVNCTAAQELRPCGECESCRAVADGRAVDVIEMDAASHTSVEDAREIIERVQFRPTSGTYKVYVIDECFRYEELVTLADGSKHPIGKIVEEQWQTEVLSYNETTCQLEPKPIVRHMRKQPTLPMVRVTLNNNRAIICTINHKFYTPQGLLRAGELEPGQFVYANFERMTRHQLEVVAGAALGDGHLGLTDSRMRGRLSVTHGVAQKPYLDYKVQLLGDLVQATPYFHHSLQSYSKTGVYRMATTSRPQIAQLHRELYNESRRKQVTITYLNHITPLGLALWYLDDGSLVTAANKHTRADGSITGYPATRSTLSTYGFTCEETQLICDWLQESWGIEARFSKTAKGPVIWLTLPGTDRLHQLITSFVPPEMQYKLLPQYRGQFCPPVDDMVVNGLSVSKVKKVERVPATEYVYNIEVADNHNYFVRDILVSNCHMLSTAAFNSLLKTLEEPPPHALFVLATTEVHKVPATILSRCQRFTFNRHTVAATALHLHGIASEEQFALEPGVAESIARAATGSMRDALSVLDQLMAYGSGTITLDQVRGLIGATEAQEVAALVDALIGGELAGALRAIAGVAAQGADLRQFTRDLVERLRALMLLKAGGDRELIDVTDDDLAALEQQAAAGELGALLHWVKLFSGLDHQLRTSAYGQLPLELAVVEAIAAPAAPAAHSANLGGATGRGIAVPPTRPAPAAARPAAMPQRPNAPTPTPPHPQPVSTPPIAHPTTAAATLAPPDQPAAPAEEALVTIAAPPPVEQPPPVEAPIDFSAAPTTAIAANDVDINDRIASDNAAAALLEQVESVWEDVLQGIKARDRTLFVLLTSSGGVKPIDIKDDMIVFEVKNDWQVKRIEQDAPRRVIEGVLSKCMGANYRISCVAEAQNRENPNVRREQIRDSRKDLHVKAAINIFDADIIDVEHNQ